MHKAQKEMRQLMPTVDVVMEILDARAPFSSSNPLLESIRGDTPLLRILNKADLADAKRTATWQAYLGERSEQVLALEARDKQQISELPAICRKLKPRSLKPAENFQVMIIGIPNVGKSTLINTLAGRKVARTGNEPAITKRQDAIQIERGFVLCDTPGILWPDLGHPNISMRLATLGSIRETVVDYMEAALFSISYLVIHYRELLKKYSVESLQAFDNAHNDPHALAPEVAFLETFGQQRGTLQRGAMVDLERAARMLVNDIRDGNLGNLTLELPEDARHESVEIEQRLQKKLEKKSKKTGKRSNKGGKKQPGR